MNSFCCGGHQAAFVAIPKQSQCFVAGIVFAIISAWPTSKIIAAGTPLPTSLPTENVENVYSVTPNSAGLGDHIEVEAGNLYEWLKEANLRRAKRNLPTATVYDLVLFINGVPFKGLHPDTYREEKPQDVDKNRGFREINYLGFQLSESDAAKSAWQGVLNRPVFSRPVTLTVGFADAPDILMDTAVLKDAQDNSNQFNLIIVRAGWQLGLGIGIIAVSLLIFLALTACTDIIRDPTSIRRPDNRKPFSLARSQMAFWFFITISAYFFLWIVTGDQNTLTNGVLTLIGISAGTALGAAFVDAGKTPEPALSFAPKVDLTQKNDEIIKSLKDNRGTALTAIETAQVALNTDLANSPVIEAKIEEDKRALDARRYELDAIDRYISFFKAPPWRRVLFDLLGDNGVIGFHRFQIFVWTLVLGVIFVANVYSGLSMPDFSPTLLALMGISAGTYIGFKIPEKN